MEKTSDQIHTSNLIPLSLASVNKLYQVVKISGTSKVKQHLQALGFNPGAPIELITNFDGNLIVRIKENSRIALSWKLGNRIYCMSLD